MRRSGRSLRDLVDEGLDRRGGPRVTASVSQGHQCRSGHQRGLLSLFIFGVVQPTTLSIGIWSGVGS